MILWQLLLPMGTSTFWSKLKERNAPTVESWISDQLESLLQMASVGIAYGIFQILRHIGVSGWLIDLLELMDRLVAVLVFGRFLWGVTRRAFTPREPN